MVGGEAGALVVSGGEGAAEEAAIVHDHNRPLVADRWKCRQGAASVIVNVPPGSYQFICPCVFSLHTVFLLSPKTCTLDA